MIKGVVNAHLEATVGFVVLGAGEQQRPVEAIVDTVSGCLTLRSRTEIWAKRGLDVHGQGAPGKLVPTGRVGWVS